LGVQIYDEILNSKTPLRVLQKKPPVLAGRAAEKYKEGITSLTPLHQSPWTSSRQSSH
jgi:hypothetical protein